MAWIPDPEPFSGVEGEAEAGDEAEDKADKGKARNGDGEKKDEDDVDDDLGGSGGGDLGEESGKAGSAAANLPDGPEKDAWASGAEVKLPTAPAQPAGGKKMTPEEELAKRFERLKQLR